MGGVGGMGDGFDLTLSFLQNHVETSSIMAIRRRDNVFDLCSGIDGSRLEAVLLCTTNDERFSIDMWAD